jgi:hypothetical protein
MLEPRAAFALGFVHIGGPSTRVGPLRPVRVELGGVAPFPEQLFETKEPRTHLLVARVTSDVIAERSRPAETSLKITKLVGCQHSRQRVVGANVLRIVLGPPIVLDLEKSECADLAVVTSVTFPLLAFTAFDRGSEMRFPFRGGDERRGHLDVTIGCRGDIGRIPSGGF